ncbi:hypothetical protein V3C99_002626 [Haemonchus contortus]
MASFPTHGSKSVFPRDGRIPTATEGKQGTFNQSHSRHSKGRIFETEEDVVQVERKTLFSLEPQKIAPPIRVAEKIMGKWVIAQ